jgi:hypothetical protein
MMTMCYSFSPFLLEPSQCKQKHLIIWEVITLLAFSPIANISIIVDKEENGKSYLNPLIPA